VTINWTTRNVFIGEANGLSEGHLWAEDDMDNQRWRDFEDSVNGVMNRLQAIDARDEAKSRRAAETGPAPRHRPPTALEATSSRVCASRRDRPRPGCCARSRCPGHHFQTARRRSGAAAREAIVIVELQSNFGRVFLEYSPSQGVPGPLIKPATDLSCR